MHAPPARVWEIPGSVDAYLPRSQSQHLCFTLDRLYATRSRPGWARGVRPDPRWPVWQMRWGGTGEYKTRHRGRGRVKLRVGRKWNGPPETLRRRSRGEGAPLSWRPSAHAVAGEYSTCWRHSSSSSLMG